jgi:hypothetical protein
MDTESGLPSYTLKKRVSCWVQVDTGGWARVKAVRAEKRIKSDINYNYIHEFAE